MSDEEWALIGPLWLSERGEGAACHKTTGYIKGAMWMARRGAQWRHLPDEYGKWNGVFQRYRRWVETGVFDAMLETFAEIAGRDGTADMIDSTVVRAHHCAVGLKKGDQETQGLGRSRGGFTTKLQARCDGHAQPVRSKVIGSFRLISPRSGLSRMCHYRDKTDRRKP